MQQDRIVNTRFGTSLLAEFSQSVPISIDIPCPAMAELV